MKLCNSDNHYTTTHYTTPVEPFQGDSSLLTTIEALGVPGTLSIDLTMKSRRGFEPANTGLVIGV